MSRYGRCAERASCTFSAPVRRDGGIDAAGAARFAPHSAPRGRDDAAEASGAFFARGAAIAVCAVRLARVVRAVTSQATAIARCSGNSGDRRTTRLSSAAAVAREASSALNRAERVEDQPGVWRAARSSGAVADAHTQLVNQVRGGASNVPDCLTPCHAKRAAVFVPRARRHWPGGGRGRYAAVAVLATVGRSAAERVRDPLSIRRSRLRNVYA